MRNTVRTILNTLGLPGDLDTLLTMLGISGGAATMTAYLAHTLGEHGHWILVAASAVFAFSMMSIYYVLLVKRQISVYGQVVMESINIRSAAVIGAPTETAIKNKRKAPPPPPYPKVTKIKALTFECILRNNSERTIFYKIRREQHSIEGKINKDATNSSSVFVIPARSPAGFILASLPEFDVPDRAPEGSIDLEILYGASEDNLRYLFKYEGTPQIGIAYDEKNARIELSILTSIKQYKHERLGFMT